VRALLIVLDSVGIGGAPDAASYGDAGADTLGHIFESRPDLHLPNLCSLGLPEVTPAGGRKPSSYSASYGRMQERSAGKDTTTGHWELAGVILEEPFAVYDRFPDELVYAIERDARVEFIGNYARSGTTVLDELGAEHVRTGKPILYTSADSVLQIAGARRRGADRATLRGMQSRETSCQRRKHWACNRTALCGRSCELRAHLASARLLNEAAAQRARRAER
jgi:phosphopentomutase